MAGVERRPVVVKIGTSSLTDDRGRIDPAAVDRVADQTAELMARGVQVVLVSSAAIAAGLPRLGIERPSDPVSLQAISAVGQIELMATWSASLARHGLVAGQVLLAPLDFMVRQQYLHARETLAQLLAMGVVPVINENDAIADDEIRYGDNDRLAALVSHLVSAEALILLTDAPGMLTGDPRLDPGATLIEEIKRVDAELERRAGGAGSARGSGGMASKLAAAKMAAWTGVRTVIAAADRPGVVLDAVADAPGVGTVVRPRERRLGARKLWIAFAVGSSGRVVVDAGARRALTERRRSLLPAGVSAVEGSFEAERAVELVDQSGEVFAKGLVRVSSDVLRELAGRHSSERNEGLPVEVIHADDLVILPD